MSKRPAGIKEGSGGIGADLFAKTDAWQGVGSSLDTAGGSGLLGMRGLWFTTLPLTL